MTTRTKRFQSVRIKDGTTGEFIAVFATLGVIDHDGDVLSKSSFTDGAPVVVSAYGHSSHAHMGARLPIGKGKIVMTDTEATVEGRFFLDTTHGRDAFLTVKALSDDDNLQEWSFSLADVVEHKGMLGNERANFIDSVRVKEVSPVLEGAGIDTRTLVAKSKAESDAKSSADDVRRALNEAGRERFASNDTYVWLEDWDVDEGTAVFSVYDDTESLLQVSFDRKGTDVTLAEEVVEVTRVTSYAPKSSRFAQHAKSVVTEVSRLIERAADVVTIRANQGKAKKVSPEMAGVVDELSGELVKLLAILDPEPEASSGISADPTYARLTIAELEASCT